MTTYDDIVTHATQGLTLKQTSKLLELSGRTIQRLCKANNTTWSDLKPKLILKQPSLGVPPSPARGEGSQPSQGIPTAHSNHSDPLPLQQLSEAIVEDAIAKVLIDNPEKALAVAVSWVEKKGKIQKDDTSENEGLKEYYSQILRDVYE